ncbi:MAG: glycosyltransferase family 25 protein [Pseudomonadota bacterium]
MRTFVIHLARATARRVQVAHIVASTPDAQVLPACDGAALPEAKRKALYPASPLFKPRYPFALSNGEIGCFESHKAAWRRIVEENLNAALIVEDDVQIDPAVFKPALLFACTQMNDWGYIQFQVRAVKGSGTMIAENDGCRLVRPDLIPLRTSAQLVSRRTAARLLEKTEQIDRPVDTFLQMRWETGVEVACAIPSGVSDRTAEAGGSTLSKKRGLIDEVKVSVPRLRYRSAIKRLSARS